VVCRPARRNQLNAPWFDARAAHLDPRRADHEFRQQQFIVIGLAVDLFIWAMVRSAIAIEEQRLHSGADAPAPDPGPTEAVAT
jgi:hypothetical protein